MKITAKPVNTSEEFHSNRIFTLLSSPWKTYILVHIGSGQIRFGALKRAVPTVSRVTLTKYLNELERDGFLLRIKHPEPPLRTDYSLTALGLEVLPLLERLVAWGDQMV